MDAMEAIVLAVLQGLTEFLPVSSSGHLVLAQHWFGQFGETNLLYDVMLHFATVTAIFVYFWDDLLTLGKGYVGWETGGSSLFTGAERKTIHFIILASIPTAILGLGIESIGVSSLARPDLVGGFLLLTGVILWVGRAKTAGRKIQDMKALDALTIGVVQGIAVFPGISRSGSTIAGGLLLGLDRELSARFSLLISIPAVLGATVLELGKALGHIQSAMSLYVGGMVVAALVGYASISLILRLVKHDHFHFFSYYLWPLGVGVILYTHVW